MFSEYLNQKRLGFKSLVDDYKAGHKYEWNALMATLVVWLAVFLTYEHYTSWSYYEAAYYMLLSYVVAVMMLYTAYFNDQIKSIDWMYMMYLVPAVFWAGRADVTGSPDIMWRIFRLSLFVAVLYGIVSFLRRY